VIPYRKFISGIHDITVAAYRVGHDIRTHSLMGHDITQKQQGELAAIAKELEVIQQKARELKQRVEVVSKEPVSPESEKVIDRWRTRSKM